MLQPSRLRVSLLHFDTSFSRFLLSPTIFSKIKVVLFSYLSYLFLFLANNDDLDNLKYVCMLLQRQKVSFVLTEVNSAW